MAILKKLVSWEEARARQDFYEPQMSAEPSLVYGMEKDWLPWGEEILAERFEDSSTIYEVWETIEIARDDFGGILIPEWAFEDFIASEENMVLPF